MFENKKILILGLARSGVAASYTLLERNNKVIINDISDESKHDKKVLDDLRKKGCQIILAFG